MLFVLVIVANVIAVVLLVVADYIKYTGCPKERGISQ